MHYPSIDYPYIIHNPYSIHLLSIYYPFIIHILSIYYPYSIHLLSIYDPYIIHIWSIYYPYIIFFYPYIINLLSIYYPYHLVWARRPEPCKRCDRAKPAGGPLFQGFSCFRWFYSWRHGDMEGFLSESQRVFMLKPQNLWWFMVV